LIFFLISMVQRGLVNC